MKHVLFIVLLAALLITAGCTGGNQNPVVTPNPPAVTPSPKTVSLTVPATPVPAVTTVPAVPAVPTATATSIPDQGSSKTYTNNEFHFAIQYPKTWTASGGYVTTIGTDTKYKVVFDDPTLTSVQYITITPGTGGLPLQDWVNVFLKQLKTDPSVGVVGQYPLELDGIPAKKLVVTTGSGQYELESTIIMAIKGDNAYFMEFESRKDTYPRYSVEADSIISTFKFT
jgi:hypothetical protein